MSIDLKSLRETSIYRITASMKQVLADLDELVAVIATTNNTIREAEIEQTKAREIAELNRQKIIDANAKRIMAFRGGGCFSCFGSTIAYPICYSTILQFIFPLLQGLDIIVINLIASLLVIAIIWLVFYGSVALFFRTTPFPQKVPPLFEVTEFPSPLKIYQYRYDSLKKVLQMLERDIDDSTDISVQVVFNSNSQLTSKQAHPTKSHLIIETYKDLWMIVEGYFLDGTQFQLTVTELLNKKHSWKDSPIGNRIKRKHKTKTQLNSDISLTLNVDQKLYQALKNFKQEVSGAIQLPQEVKLKALKVTGKSMYLEVITPLWIEVTQVELLYTAIAMMFLSLYQVLNLARMLSKNAIL